jgi:serine/threonine protein kinase
MTTLDATSFLDTLQLSKLVDTEKLNEVMAGFAGNTDDSQEVSQFLISQNIINDFQAKSLLAGKHKGLKIGPYVILKKIGAGGMGVVYLAEHQKMHRKVALKVLPEDRTNDKLALERFYREARSVAELDHPNIVKAHDVNEDAGIHYLVMEYINGITLHRYLEKKGTMSWKMVANVLQQVCRGLQHAHERGLIHRDIKPANLLIDKSGQVKILDLGLARSLEKRRDNLTADLSDGKDVQGSIDYVSPEQAFGKQVDIRADIYSLGATAYTLVSGRTVVEGSPVQKLLQHQMNMPKPLHLVNKNVPEAFSFVIQTMLEKQPQDRYATPADIVSALKQFFATPSASNSEPLLTATLLDQEPAPSTDNLARSAMESTQEMMAPKTKVIKRPAKKFKKKKKRASSTGRWLVLAAVLLMLGGAAWGGYALLSNSGGSKGQQALKAPAKNDLPNKDGGNSGQSANKDIKLTEGSVVPDIVGEDLDKSNFRLSDYEGKVILLDFWGFWCPHCVKLIPHENQLVNRYKSRPFSILGVNNDKDEATITAGMKKHSVQFRSFKDKLPDGASLAKKCGVKGFPTLVLIDHTGVIRKVWVGAPSTGELDNAIEAAVKKAERDGKKS